MKNSIKTFIIVGKDDVQSEEDIYIIKAKNIDDAIKQYARETHLKNNYLKDTMENRGVNHSFWEQFFTPILNYDENSILMEDSEGNFLTNFNDQELKEKFKGNIEKYCGGNKSYARDLIDFYYKEDKTFEELSKELVDYILLTEKLKDRDYIIIKELN